MDRVKSGAAVRAAIAAVIAVGLLVSVLALAVLRVGGAADMGASAEVSVAPAPSAAGVPATRSSDLSRSAARPVVDPAWVARVAAAAGIPPRALRAYAVAELILRAQQPGCHLSWNTLAGIGWVESQHGTVGGRTLDVDGRSSRPVLGPALDGARGLAAIHSTPASAGWHGDTVWEHAVGPLQFIASTWDRWASDGDGDGVADPLDVDDAAYAAGRYLCADGHDLATSAGWTAAVLSYNHDRGYVLAVNAAARTYASRS
jgi:membrane-bound lytic murein transglycosylase B